MTLSPVTAASGMVATSQRLATATGLDILKAGGSAIDAAIAANAMLSLTEPHMCGPGGDLFAIVWDPRSRELIGLNASGRSPQALSSPDLSARLPAAPRIPARGPLCVTTPGAIDGWSVLHGRFGKLPLREILAPTIRAARDGVTIAERTATWWSLAATELLQEPLLATSIEPFKRTYARSGRGPQGGERFANPGLARAYEAIAAHGREAFYTGEIAAAIVACHRAAGGDLSAADLADCRAEWVSPLRTTYRGFEVCELPPNGQGACVLQMLNVLQDYPLARMGIDAPDWWHLFLETKKLVFEDRARYYADPEFARIPIEHLISQEYAATRRALIDQRRAQNQLPHGQLQLPGGDTTYLAVADRDGMMVSFIQSIFQAFGSGLVVPEFGFALHSRGAGFALTPAHPNAYAPGKRPFHTIIPGFVLRDGEPLLSFGVMGADMQPQGQVQVLVNILDFGMDPQAAGAAPRMRHSGGSQPDGTRQAGGVVQYEPEFSAALIKDLAARGHAMQPLDKPIPNQVGGYQAVWRDAAAGLYVGASEPRFDGCALGY